MVRFGQPGQWDWGPVGFTAIVLLAGVWWRDVRPPIYARMNYVLALFLPPLSILFAGRPIVAIVTLLIWIPAAILSGGLTHPMFIILAWILIYQGQAEKRDRRS